MDTSPCGDKDYAYSYSDDQSRNFHLGDDLSLNADPFLGSLPADAVLTSCKCTATLQGQPGSVTFQGVGGELRRGPPVHFRLDGTAGIVNLQPSIELICPNGAGTVAPISPTPFFLAFLGLPDGHGLRPSNRTQRFAPIESPSLTIILEWHSVTE